MSNYEPKGANHCQACRVVVVAARLTSTIRVQLAPRNTHIALALYNAAVENVVTWQ